MNISENVLAKNNQFIAFNKPAGIPVQEDKTGDKSLVDLAEIYTKSKLHLVHRLDRASSGVVLFAKTPNGLANLNEQFRERKVAKTYLAIVQVKPEKESGKLVHYLSKNAKDNKAHISDEEGRDAKRAEMNYTVVASSDNYHLLEVDLLTGRHHQIRAQLAAIGSPIKGDVKYGARRSNLDRSIHLHAWKLYFKHPVTKQTVELEADLPKDSLWDYFKQFIAVKNTGNPVVKTETKVETTPKIESEVPTEVETGVAAKPKTVRKTKAAVESGATAEAAVTAKTKAVRKVKVAEESEAAQETVVTAKPKAVRKVKEVLESEATTSVESVIVAKPKAVRKTKVTLNKE
jgi:23S rRNA pseudouridine1911/1915/1917 synthase